mmetsp:Transcript_28947/g.53193  ORF Transcript_28947/g.53193 Transcript_28947/m.53193 type:complete len:486 (-) Transcript_28947:1025-2482(-)|eukprot:CAMPEP_0175041688 /NCGR_PEP_ID=MMETSP0052_2-20121109/2080_1 /TAXON_ID=51329 ORGANISM="Polytomella parva, Strain SAG 63-3" /NCGR_SAMPLE_ID=MMETSP0052_2 /ASSEMBLY_ACC=CAM_ASM_000194 /LENGTH=485 /DNA_ID=CAMNT_0016304283 /DNA_START=89 /DNA_END=1546 /DNA_ORIENTATION=-
MYNEVTEDTKPVRIAALFTILVTSIIAGLLPLIFEVLQNPISWPTRIVRSLGSGVILALALIHIIPDSVEMLGSITTYDPLGGVVVLGGILLVIIPEHLVNIFIGENEHVCQHGPAATSMPPSGKGVEGGRYYNVHDHTEDGGGELCCMPDSLDPEKGIIPAPTVFPIECCGTDAIMTLKEDKDGCTTLTVVHEPSVAVRAFNSSDSNPPLPEAYLVPSPPHHHHKHAAGCTVDGKEGQSVIVSTASALQKSSCGNQCAHELNASSKGGVGDSQNIHSKAVANAQKGQAVINNGKSLDDSKYNHGHIHENSSSTPSSASSTGVDARLRVLAFIFEFGCIFHSVIVGIDMGVNISDIKSARALFAALVFHQGLEGISLGTVIVQGKFFGWRGVFMVLAYSITCPIGIAIGMGIATSYNPDSLNALVVQGVFDGISGGMLLYIALVQLLAEDMGRIGRGPKSIIPRLVSVIGMCIGAGGMATIAIWA